jgi:hypothetical protein
MFQLPDTSSLIMDKLCTASPMTTNMGRTLVIWKQIRVMKGDNAK